MNIAQINLSKEQRTIALQRLTALWAFSESGLGGIMHALKIPFSGLLVGGMSVIMICFIAELSSHQYKEILKSALIVLIIKAMVSPYTPFPAYIAVSFQALAGFTLFSLFRVNLVSILLLSVITVLESAIQQLLILTLFFGRSLWKAMDDFAAIVSKQLNIAPVNGSQWVISIYLLIYLAGGIFIAWMAWKALTGFSLDTAKEQYSDATLSREVFITVADNKKNNSRKLWVIITLLVVLSVFFYFLAADTKQGWIAILKTVSWTLSVIMIWYMLISPLFTKLIKQVLLKKESRYSEEVTRTLSFLPVLRRLTTMAWQKSKLYKGSERWHIFLSTLIHWSLTYNDQPANPLTEKPFNLSA